MLSDMSHNLNYINLRNDLLGVLLPLLFITYFLLRSFYFSASMVLGFISLCCVCITYFVYDMYRYINRHIRENSLDELEFD